MKKTALLWLFFFAFSFQAAASAFSANDSLAVNIANLVNTSCFGYSDGAISLEVQGTPPFAYSWNNGDTDKDIANLQAGIYEVVVTDSIGTQVILSGIEIAQPDELQVSLATVLHPTCNGHLGALTIVAEGGTANYDFLWNTGGTENDLQSLNPDIYTATVTDAQGCSASFSYDLQPQLPQMDLYSDGNITCIQSEVRLSGAVSSSDFIFDWSATNGGAFTGNIDTLEINIENAGTYTLTITDTISGCTNNMSVDVIEDKVVPTVFAGADTTVTCSNQILSLSGNANNGNNFTYQWNTIANGNIIAGANTAISTIDLPGTYELEVTNAENGCVAADTIVVIALNAAPFATAIGSNITCLITETNLIAQADTTDKTYSWSGPNGFLSNDLLPTVQVPGTYVFEITDTVTTCSTSIPVELEDDSAGPAIVVEDGMLNCVINSTSLEASTTSGDAIYSWSGPNAFTASELSPVITESGIYILTVTDTLTGCTASAEAIVLSDLTQPTADAGSVSTLNCYNPNIQLNGSASSQGNQYAYAWATLDGNISAGENTLNPTVGSAGSYQLIVTDQINGCTASSDVTILSNFATPAVDVFGGTVSCFETELLLISNFDTLHAIYSWTGPQGFISNLQTPIATLSGDYILTVTDTTNGCSTSAVAIVDKIGIDPVLTLTGGTLTCYEPNIQLTVEANIDGIVWSWASENGFTATDQNPTVTEPGFYHVLAIDTVYGCIALDSVFIENDQIMPDVNTGDNLTFNCSVNSAVLNGSASLGSVFSYLWTTTDGNIVDGETTLNPTVDAAGNYTLTVTNAANGCVSESNMTISQTPPIALVATAEDATCYGAATGSAAVTITGGTGNFISTVWSSGGTSITAADLVAGDYTITVTDTDGCTAEAAVTVQQPNILTADAIGIGQSLAGINDGTAIAIPSGGTQPYFYEWDNGATTENLADLAPGSYTVTITDTNGCREIATANVNAFPCVLSSSIVGIDASCNGVANGSAAVILGNEIAPFQYTWSNGDSTGSVQNLLAGIYTVSVSDSTNCQNILTISIKEPSAINVVEIFHVDVDCPDDAIGFVIVGANGGAQPYQYEWSNGSTTNVANGLSTGNYDLTLTDANDCTHTYQTNIWVSDSQEPELLLQNIEIKLDENGVTSLSASQLDAGTTDNCGSVTLEVDIEEFDCTQIGLQTVTVVATDLNGNQSMGTATVMVVDERIPMLTCPTDIIVSACDSIVNFAMPAVSDNCTIDITQLQQTTGFPTGSAFPLGLTIQSFKYTDPAGNVGECAFEVVLVEEMAVSNSLAQATCHQVCDGTISLTITDGLPPFQVNWSNGEAGETLTGLCAGLYSATITDAGGCETTISTEIEEPSVLEVNVLSTEGNFCANDLNGSVSIEATGGTAPYSLVWSNGLEGDIIENLASGIYQVTATDGNGCEQVLSAEVQSLDTEAPVLVLQNAVINLDANGSVALDPIIFDSNSSDNCAIESWSVSPANLDCSQLGEIEITVTAIDGSGNTSSSTAMVTLVDNIAPVLTCPANITVGFCNPTVTFSLPIVADNCNVDLTGLEQTTGLNSGAAFPTGTTTQSYKYSDPSGNEGTCSFTVTVFEAAILSAQNNDISCAGECDGEINLTVFGPASPFAVQWNDGQIGTSAIDLCSGPHSATITDAYGCLQSFTTILDAPTPLILTIDEVVNDANSAALGSIRISVIGGNAPYSYAWKKDGQTYTSTTQDLVGLTEGVYTVTVFDANGCEVASGDITINNTTSTSEPIWANGLTIQPNPASDWTKLQLTAPLTGDLDVRLFDINGKSIRSFTLKNGDTEKELNLESIPAGVYSIQLRSGEKLVTRRLVVGK